LRVLPPDFHVQHISQAYLVEQIVFPLPVNLQQDVLATQDVVAVVLVAR
jgi:hypothetical protein